MKKALQPYLISWGILIALFNVISFVYPGSGDEGREFTSSFWVGYAFITFTFILHLIYACVSLSSDNREKTLVNIPIMYISIFEFVVMIIVGVVTMIQPKENYWLGIIVCFAVLGLSVILFFAAKGVGENLSEANRQINVKTENYRMIVDQASLLVNKASTPEQKEIAKNIYDAARYSDSVSSESTLALENWLCNAIMAMYDDFGNNVPAETLKANANEILMQLQQRNNLCKQAKRLK